MKNKTIVYIGNGIGTKINSLLTEEGYDVVPLQDINQFAQSSRMALIIADDRIENCHIGEEVICTIDNVVFIRNQKFPGVQLVIYTGDDAIARYYLNRGYTVLSKTSDHGDLKKKVQSLLGGLKA